MKDIAATIWPRWIFALLLGIGLIVPLTAQQVQDDPRFDHQQGLVPEGIHIPPSLGPIEVITSDDGFDNFNMGIDFSEPHIAANPLHPQEYFNAWNTNAAHFTHNGFDWRNSTPPFPGFSLSGDPVTAYDSLGNLYYINMYSVGGSIQGAVSIRSTDNGLSWFSPVVAVSGFDKCWLAADQTMGPYANYVYAVMTGGIGGNFARSTDQGATWQTTFATTAQNLPGMMVAVGPDVLDGNNISGGCVYVVTNGGSSTSPIYTFFRSKNGGATFDQMSSQAFANFVGTFVNGRHSVENMRTRPYPFIAADNSFGTYRGRLYVVYANNEPVGSGNKPDIWCRYSDNQGTNWSAPVRINDDPNPQDNHQWQPAIWTDKDTGRLYAKWYDTRRTPTSDSTDVYASYSDDGGVTWAPNQRLTTEKFRIDCSSCGGGGTPRYQGDYDAIVSNNVTSMSVWGDFRNGNFGSYAAYFPDFAMLVSTVSDTASLSDSLEVMVSVPAVKLYDYSVSFSAEADTADGFTISFPAGDTLHSYPDSLPVKIAWSNMLPRLYTITITGEGPNGTPVHKRDIELLLTDPFVTLQAPNGGEIFYARTATEIVWNSALLDTVKLEFSADGGTTWELISDSAIAKHSSTVQPPKLRDKPGQPPIPLEGGLKRFDWIVPNQISDNCLVRVSNLADPAVMDVSDTPFSIIAAPQPRWRAQVSGTDSALYSISVIDTNNAWAAGAGGVVLRTTDGGTTWTPTASNPGGEIYNIYGESFVRALTAVKDSAGARISRSLNLGIIWVTVYEDTNNAAFFNDIHIFDGNNGYVMGDPVDGQWTLLRTPNLGTTWSVAANLPQDGDEAGWNNGMWWNGTENGWFGTTNNRVYRTTDGGDNWEFASTSFTNSIAVAFADEQLGIAAGDGMARSSDGGATWNDTPAQLTETVLAGAAVDAFGARWYFGAGNSVYRTDDQGGSFQIDHTSSAPVYAMDMKIIRIDGNDWICGYIAGEDGTISKYIELVTFTALPGEPAALPGSFALLQNYPNPFNPGTVISYQLPARAEVSLKIFNLLGQEVRTLVNRSRDAGFYRHDWDGRDAAGNTVSSGVYFYRMEATAANGKRFQQTRKMLLLK